MKKTPGLFPIAQIAFLTLTVILLLVGCQEETFSPALTQEFTLQADANGATYRIKVALPGNYGSTNNSYSTIYVLDGDENFDFVANHCQKISNDQSVDNVIVVSIGYGNDRSIDYTPTEVSSVTGGAPQFLEFIRNQLIPTMEQRYRADTTRNGRVILGHSYGGLFGGYAFAVDNKLFGNYLLLSPSLWFDNEVTMLFEKENRELNKKRQQLVFMGIGEMENAGRMQAPFEAFYETLLKNYPNIAIAKNREENLSHMGSKFPNTILGLKYYFEHRSR